MTKPTLLYLHGFCSSPASWKARLLADTLAARGQSGQWLCPSLPHHPEAAITLCRKLIDQCQGPVTVIGSSLGGHYANYLAETCDLKAILVNPAVIARMDLSRFIGSHENFHTGETFRFSPTDADQLRQQSCTPTPDRYWVLLETGDEVLDYRDAAAFYNGAQITCLNGGDHSFTRFAEFIPRILAFAGLSTPI